MSGRTTKRTKTSGRRRRVDVADPKQLLDYLHKTHREQLRIRQRLDALEVGFNDVVKAVNGLLQGRHAQTGETPAPAPAPEAPIIDRSEMIRAAAAARAGGKQAMLLKLLMAKRPELAEKLAGLPACANHASFTIGCADCQQGAIAGLQ